MLKKLRIAPKLVVCFMIAVAIASISGVVGIFVLINTDANYSSALVNNGFAQGYIGQFNTYLNKGGAIVRDIVLFTDPTEKQASQDELEAVIAKADDALRKVKTICTSSEEKQLLATIEDALSAYRGYRDQVIEMGLQNKNAEALALFRSEARPILNQAMGAAEELSALKEKTGNEVSQSLTKGTNTAILAMVAGILAAVFIAILFSIIVARSISKPIILVQKAAAQLEQGDLNISIETDLQDEIGAMSRSFTTAAAQLKAYIVDISRGLSEVAYGNFNICPSEVYKGDFKAIEKAISVIIVSLSETMAQVSQASDQVAAGSDQVASGAQALAQGATEQASSVQELAATINEISGQVRATAEHAEHADSLSNKSSQEVDECSDSMAKLNDAMMEISQTSGEIEKIIKTIEDIAFQTNILALNAAVEAARAGEAGKGFAVVADEVRNLASKSAGAAKNTTALIEGAIRAVENGSLLATHTVESLQRVVESAVGVSETIGKISTATGTQALALSQVTEGIEQISNVVQTNSATAEESAAASEELSAQARMMKDLMNKFRLSSMV